MTKDELTKSMNTVEAVAVPRSTPDAPHLEVVGIYDLRPCAYTKHIGGVVLADMSKLPDTDAITLIDSGRVLWMTPPPGAQAYEACKATGAKLVLQVRVCQDCNGRVLFA